MLKTVKWEFLFKKDFEERLNECPLVYLPMGLCEPHGHGAVLGLDLIKAEYLCEEAARRWGGIVAPSQGFQIHESGFHAPWLAEVVGNINTRMTSMPPAPMLYFFLYQLRAFHNAGFQWAFILSGHAGGNQEDFRLAAKLFMEKTDMHVAVYTDPELTKFPGDHAGKYEISQLMYINRECVDKSRLNEWEKESPETRFAQGEDAAEASVEYGKEIIEDLLSGIRGQIKNKISKIKTHRELMAYKTVEEVWENLQNNKKKWISTQLKDGQNPAPESSIWKQFEENSLD